MRISGFQKSSFQDWPGHLSSVIYFSGCNFKCPACHAKHVIEGNGRCEEEVLGNLGLVKRVVLTGGEPTLQLGLANFIRKLKERGLAVKLDTNGSQFSVLQQLREEGLVDYVAMDIKGPATLYSSLVGLDHIDHRDYVEKGMSQVQMFPDYEYRTTIVPIFKHPPRTCRLYLPEFLNRREAEEMANWVVSISGNNQHNYFLQPFVARSKHEILNPRLVRENLPQNMHRTPEDVLEEVCKGIKKYVPKCKIRGK